MKKLLIILLISASFSPLFSQEHFIMQLWPAGAPESNGYTENKPEEGVFTMVTNAELWVYLPEKAKANGQAVVLCPGGGYWGLAFNHEGVNAAKWLNKQGVAGIVLKYRMPNGNPEIPSKDVRRAIEITRENSEKWNISTDKVGVMGSSAGGHLASTAATHYTSTENRPDFAILIYPVITMRENLTHIGSRENLLGKNATEAIVAKYSNDEQVTENTPPAFIVFSNDDNVVDPRNGTLFYNALKAKNVPAEIHIYPSGGHGWGWSDGFKYVSEYRTSLGRWLSEQM